MALLGLGVSSIFTAMGAAMRHARAVLDSGGPGCGRLVGSLEGAVPWPQVAPLLRARCVVDDAEVERRARACDEWPDPLTAEWPAERAPPGSAALDSPEVLAAQEALHPWTLALRERARAVEREHRDLSAGAWDSGAFVRSIQPLRRVDMHFVLPVATQSEQGWNVALTPDRLDSDRLYGMQREVRRAQAERERQLDAWFAARR